MNLKFSNIIIISLLAFILLVLFFILIVKTKEKHLIKFIIKGIIEIKNEIKQLNDILTKLEIKNEIKDLKNEVKEIYKLKDEIKGIANHIQIKKVKYENRKNEKLVIHALGKYNNTIYTNSLKALKYCNLKKNAFNRSRF